MANDKLYDLSFLNKISEGDKSFISEMIKTYIETTGEYFSKADEYCQQNNFQALGKETHKYIPGVSFLGLKTLEDVLLIIEDNCKKTQKLEEVKDLVHDAEHIANEILKQFREDFND